MESEDIFVYNLDSLKIPFISNPNTTLRYSLSINFIFARILLYQINNSIPDSIAVMAGYADVVVLRHPQPGAVAVS